MREGAHMDKKSLRFKVGICNIIISVLCVLSIVSYFFMPFWKVAVAYTVTPEMLQEILDGATEGSEDMEDLEFDAAEVVGEEGITLELSIRLKTADMLAAIGGDATDSVQALIDDNVSNIIDDLYPTLSKIASNTAKVTVKTTVYAMVDEELEGHEEVRETMDAAGVTEDYIDGEIDKLMTTIDEGAHVDEITAQIVDTIDDVFNKLNTYDASTYDTLDASTKEEITDEVKEILLEIADDEGHIKTDELIASLLLELLEETEDSASTNNVVSTSFITAAAEEESGSSVDELKAKLTDLILDQIPEDSAEMIAMIMKVIGFVFIFTAFTWFYIILKILVKMRKTNNAVKLKLPIWLGWLPCLILVFIPSLAFRMLSKPDGLMAKIAGADTAAEMAEMLGNLSVSFSSASIISFAIAMAFVIFSIAYYGRLRRKLKKIRKAEKKGISLED